MLQYFPQIAAVLALTAPIVYIRAILKGEAQPHRTTRLVLMIITVITATALYFQGDRVALWLAVASALQASVIFGMSVKYGVGGRDALDVACLIIAVVGVVLWRITDQPLLALYFAIMADFVGGVPMFIKTWKRPDSEVWSYYAFDVVGATLIILATAAKTFENLLYPVYILLVNALVIALVIIPRKKHA